MYTIFSKRRIAKIEGIYSYKYSQTRDSFKKLNLCDISTISLLTFSDIAALHITAHCITIGRFICGFSVYLSDKIIGAEHMYEYKRLNKVKLIKLDFRGKTARICWCWQIPLGTYVPNWHYQVLLNLFVLMGTSKFEVCLSLVTTVYIEINPTTTVSWSFLAINRLSEQDQFYFNLTKPKSAQSLCERLINRSDTTLNLFIYFNSFRWGKSLLCCW